MTNILAQIYHDDPLSYQTLCNIDSPQTPEERHVAAQLRAVDGETAEKLKAGIRVLADRQSEEAFYDGVRFGAQLMAELLAQ
ncbi:hypothetical protein [uncultured Oscillibacter sp.]|uniref:hypothetical protein n=1 Tax=uncultured Oscillibacter sp. TaxID=876091 RepID=UPI0025FD04A8|nr:hypothetical protein [uncultured Oscillibacter sp.]